MAWQKVLKYYNNDTNEYEVIPKENATWTVLVVAGGGAGGLSGGGGGAGGVRYAASYNVNTNVPIVAKIGAGGLITTGNGGDGENSSFGTLTATGGGGGGTYLSNGKPGGSGGGAPRDENQRSGGAGNLGGYTPVEGYSGGNNRPINVFPAGGGGGAGGAGVTPTTNNGGAGGVGVDYSAIFGTSVGVNGWFAGGGGGGTRQPSAAGAGGAGGGGAGNNAGAGTFATSGLPNTGGGGGGGGQNSVNFSGGNGGNGGSGIIIIKGEGQEPSIVPDIVEFQEIAPQLNGQAVWSLLAFNNKVYGGTGWNALLFEWNGTNAWIQVAPQLNTEEYILSLIEFNGKIYAGTGDFNLIAGRGGRLFEWNGTNAWIQVAGTLNNVWGVLALVIKDNELYATTTPSGGTTNSGRLLKWNGTNAWIQVVGSLTNNSNIVQTPFVLGNKIYAGTQSLQSGTSGANGGRIFEWEEGNANWIVTYSGHPSYYMSWLTRYNNKFYFAQSLIAGQTPSLGGLVEWTDPVTSVAPIYSNQNTAIPRVFNDRLYVGTSDGFLLRWNDVDNWELVGFLPTGVTQLYHFTVLDNYLYFVGRASGKLFRFEDTATPPPPEPTGEGNTKAFLLDVWNDYAMKTHNTVWTQHALKYWNGSSWTE